MALSLLELEVSVFLKDVPSLASATEDITRYIDQNKKEMFGSIQASIMEVPQSVGPTIEVFMLHCGGGKGINQVLSMLPNVQVLPSTSERSLSVTMVIYPSAVHNNVGKTTAFLCCVMWGDALYIFYNGAVHLFSTFSACHGWCIAGVCVFSLQYPDT